MAAYRGKNLSVTADATEITGDGRNFTIDESADTLDSTVYGADARGKEIGLTDGTFSFEGLDSTGNWTTAWGNLVPGTSVAFVVYPEGSGTGKRRASFTGIITSRSLSTPYEELSTISVGGEISGTVTYDLAP